jgi:hypothetical protein
LNLRRCSKFWIVRSRKLMLPRSLRFRFQRRVATCRLVYSSA